MTFSAGDALTTANALVGQLEALARAERIAARPGHHRQALPAYLHARQSRRDHFGDLFGDPAWDMLLALVLCEQVGELVSITALCLWSDGPPTTALRHITKLEKAGLIERVADRHDRRRQWMALTDRARRAWLAWSGSNLPGLLT